MSDYLEIAKHYENCLNKHGDNNRGLDWPNTEGMLIRYKVMSEIIKEPDKGCNLLDIGCGTGAFYSYLREHKPCVTYSGADINQNSIDLCNKKFPYQDRPDTDKGHPHFFQADLLNTQDASLISKYDYVVMNGIFTAKYSLNYLQMLNFLKNMLVAVFAKTKVGMAFNTMSKHVAWERDDLFHLPHDEIANFITKELGTRNFVFRNDYGLYEYTTYVYK